MRSDEEPHLDLARLEGMVTKAASWPHGPLQLVAVTRIGAVHGLSARVYRAVGTAGGEPVSLIVKQERAEAVDRALLFHGSVGTLDGSIPACFGGWSDASGDGVLVLEDISPATQGDVLSPPSDADAASAVRVLAHVHAASWRHRDRDHSAEYPRWYAEPWDDGRWTDRLARAQERFPQLLTDHVARHLGRLHRHLPRAIADLQAGPVAWVHGDAHLDNFLWRPDGSAVLLDWSGASIGPPAVDVARFLIEGPRDAAVTGARRASLIASYKQELVGAGRSERDASTVGDGVPNAMLPLAQSMIGWAGRPDTAPVTPRMAALRRNAVANACAWVASAV